MQGTKKWKPFRVIRKQYKRGYNFEKRVKKEWEQKGFYAMDSRGSHGVADLIVHEPISSTNPTQRAIHIQCKLKQEGMSQREMKRFKKHCKLHGVEGLLAFNVRGKTQYIPIA